MTVMVVLVSLQMHPVIIVGAHILPHSKGSEVGLGSLLNSMTSFCTNVFSLICLVSKVMMLRGGPDDINNVNDIPPIIAH